MPQHGFLSITAEATILIATLYRRLTIINFQSCFYILCTTLLYLPWLHPPRVRVVWLPYAHRHSHEPVWLPAGPCFRKSSLKLLCLPELFICCIEGTGALVSFVTPGRLTLRPRHFLFSLKNWGDTWSQALGDVWNWTETDLSGFLFTGLLRFLFSNFMILLIWNPDWDFFLSSEVTYYGWRHLCNRLATGALLKGKATWRSNQSQLFVVLYHNGNKVTVCEMPGSHSHWGLGIVKTDLSCIVSYNPTEFTKHLLCWNSDREIAFWLYECFISFL